MKRLFFLFSIVMFSQLTFGQTDFCVPGATWVYYHQGGAANFEVERGIRYVSDTIIGGRAAKILRVETRSRINWPGNEYPYPINYGEGFEYVHQRNDSVFKWVDENWELVFDFNVNHNDTSFVFLDNWGGCPSGSDTLITDSVYITQFQGTGLSLRRYDYHMLISDRWSASYGEIPSSESDDRIGSSYLERVGFVVASPVFQPVNCAAFALEYLPLSLICYTDNEILLNGGSPCELIMSVDDTKEQHAFNLILRGNHIQVANAPNSTLHIYDILGKELLQAPITSDNQSFDLNGLPNGILMVVVETETGRFTKKVIKTSY